MNPAINHTIAALIVSIGLSSAAYAVHPCKTEHQTAKAACASDKHSPDCKAAHKAVKSCRAAHGLPVRGHGKSTSAPGSIPANSTPATNTPAAPTSH